MLTEKLSFNCPSGEVILSAFADVPKKKREQQADPHCSSYFHVLHDINELVNNRMAKIDRKSK